MDRGGQACWRGGQGRKDPVPGRRNSMCAGVGELKLLCLDSQNESATAPGLEGDPRSAVS